MGKFLREDLNFLAEHLVTYRSSRAMHFDGTAERIPMLPELYDYRRPAGYGGQPERRVLSGTCRAIHAAQKYSAEHPRIRVTVFVGGIDREYRAGKRVGAQ